MNEYYVIISFSTDWEQAYREVCQTGSTKSHRARINIIGYYRAGKSSLLRRLLGEPFLRNIKSTEGIHIVRIKTTYDNTHKVLGPWQKSILQTDDITQDFNDMLKDIIDVRMKVTGTEKSSSTEPESSPATSTKHDTSSATGSNHYTILTSTEHATSPTMSSEQDTSHDTSTVHDTSPVASTEHDTRDAANTEHVTSPASSTEHDTSHASSTEHDTRDAANTEDDTSHDTSTEHDTSPATSTEHAISPTTNIEDTSNITRTEHDTSHTSTEQDTSHDTSTGHDASHDTGTEHDTSPTTDTDFDASQATATEHNNSHDRSTEHNMSAASSTEHDTISVTGTEQNTSPATIIQHDTSQAISTELENMPTTRIEHVTSSTTSNEHHTSATSTEHDTSHVTGGEHDISPAARTKPDTSSASTEQNTSPVTSAEPDTSSATSTEHDTSHDTSTEHDTSPATNAEHDTSHPTSSEHDTSPTTSAEHETSHDRSTEHEASHATSAGHDSSHATSIEHYTSHDTSTEHDTSQATGTKGKSTEQDTNHVTKTEHDTSPGTSTEEDTNQDTSIEHDTSHATSTERDTSHDDAHKEQTKKPEGENNKSKFYDGADEQEKKSSKPKLSWGKEEKLQAHVIFENVDPSSLDIRLDSRSKLPLLEPRRSYRKREFEDTTQCLLFTWDFGGQVEYYATHHLFLDALAVNLITMDVTKGIYDVIPSQFDNTSTASIPKTAGQFLDYWLSTIYKKGNLQGTEPSIAIILTHIDEIENVKWSVDDYISDIIQYTRNKPYSEYVNRTNIFPVSNKDGDAQQFLHLRKEIFEKARRQTSWGLDRPTRWLKLEAEIYEEAKRKQVKYFDITKIIELAANFGIDEKETHNFLTFHHVMGDLVHFNEENLSNLVIIDPQWLVDMFKAIVTPHDFITRRLTADMPLKEFQQSALLTQELLEILWEGNDVQFLINLIQNLDLIIPVHHEGIQKYLVPCMLPPHKSDMYETQPFKSMIMVYSSFYIKPGSNFIPIGDLHRILAICSRIDNWRLCDFDHLTYTDTSFKLQKGVRVAFSLVKQGRPETEAIRVTVWYSKEAIRKGALCLLPPTHRNIMNSMGSLFELKNGSFLLACPDTLFDNDRNNHADMNFRGECMIPVRINPNDTLQLEEFICPIHRNLINMSTYRWFLYPSLAQTSAINDSPASSLTSLVIGR